MCCVVEELIVSTIHIEILQGHNNYIIITTASHDHCEVNTGDK